MNQKALVLMREGPNARVGHLSASKLPTDDRYRLDPWAHVEDGHVIVPDVVTMQPRIWTPYQHQIELVEEWVDLDYLRKTAKDGLPILRFRDAFEEKSRQMGVTWAVAWAMLWALHYHRVALLAIHEHLSELDDGGRAATIDSLFGRILYMAKGEIDVGQSVWPQHSHPLRHLQFRTKPSIIRNVARPGTHLSAEGATPDPARGRKYAGVFLDEAARIPWSEQVHSSVRSACPTGKLYNSTPYGTGNAYGRIAKERPMNYVYLRHHWSDHPLYSIGVHVAGESRECDLCAGNRRGERWDAQHPMCHRYPGKLTSPWYDKAVLDMTNEQIAQELEIDYSGALTGRVYPEFSEEVHLVPSIPYQPQLPILLSWDYGVTTTAVGIFQETPTEFLQIGEVEVTHATPEKVTEELIEVLADLGVALTDLEPQFTRQWYAVGDPSGEGKTPETAEPLTRAYANRGFTIQSQWKTIDQTIRATKRLLQGTPKRYRLSGEACPLTLEHWRENRWPTDRSGNVNPNAREPKNDKHNHMLRGIAYLITFRFPAEALEGTRPHATIGNAVAPGDALGGLYRRVDGDYGYGYGSDEDDSSGRIDSGISPDMGF